MKSEGKICERKDMDATSWSLLKIWNRPNHWQTGDAKYLKRMVEERESEK